jgi:hypothetical protein
LKKEINALNCDRLEFLSTQIPPISNLTEQQRKTEAICQKILVKLIFFSFLSIILTITGLLLFGIPIYILLIVTFVDYQFRKEVSSSKISKIAELRQQVALHLSRIDVEVESRQAKIAKHRKIVND